MKEKGEGIAHIPAIRSPNPDDKNQIKKAQTNKYVDEGKRVGIVSQLPKNKNKANL